MEIGFKQEVRENKLLLITLKKKKGTQAEPLIVYDVRRLCIP